MPALVFGNYTQQELDAQYDNQAWCPSFPQEMARYRELSDAAAGLPGSRDLAWGPHAAERLDVYRPRGAARPPVVVYVHGGGWLQLGKEDNAFAAEGLVAAGCMLVVLGFPKVPAVTLGQMVDSVRRGVAWVHARAAALGGDPDRILLVGHSSGSHLVSQCLSQDWQAPPPFQAAILASGLGDLEPVRLSYRNARLNLTPDDVARYSLLRQAPGARVPVAVVTARGDTDEFHRQADAVAAHLAGHGMLAGRHDIEGRHHFDVIIDLGRTDTLLHRMALDLLRTGDAPRRP